VVGVVKDQDHERWMQLCEQASHEANPAKLLKLVEEINKLLEEREAEQTNKLKQVKTAKA
jgi:hypothetical protein